MKTKAIGPVLTTLSAVVFGFFLGISFPVAITPKCGILPWNGTTGAANCSFGDIGALVRLWAPFSGNITGSTSNQGTSSNATSSGIAEAATRNPEADTKRRLPRGDRAIGVRSSSAPALGSSKEDSVTRKYLLVLEVGYDEPTNINVTVHKFSDNFDIVMVHYDGRTTEWDEFEWSREVTHISARKQTK